MYDIHLDCRRRYRKLSGIRDRICRCYARNKTLPSKNCERGVKLARPANQDWKFPWGDEGIIWRLGIYSETSTRKWRTIEKRINRFLSELTHTYIQISRKRWIGTNISKLNKKLKKKKNPNSKEGGKNYMPWLGKQFEWHCIGLGEAVV